jgi:DNA helicase HerA-like ATPase
VIKLGIPLIAKQGYPAVKEGKRFQHAVIFGGTGKGKTTYLLNLINQEKDNPQIILDPNGSLAEQVVRLDIDPDRVVYVSKDRPLSLNPLDLPRDRSEISNELAQVINAVVKSYNPGQYDISVQMGRIIRNGLAVLPDMDMKKLFDLLSYKDERQKYKTRFWQTFDDRGEHTREQIASANRIVARLSIFLEDENMVRFVSGKNEFDILNIIKEKKIFIFNLERFDDEVSTFIGCLVSHQLKNYYLTIEGKPGPLYFYCDEFHRFFTEYFNRFMVEARRRNLSINTATHSLSMLDSRLQSITRINNHIQVVLSCSGEEADVFAKDSSTKPDIFLSLKPHEGIVLIDKKPHKILTYKPPALKEEFYLPPLKTAFNFLRDDWFPA